MSTASSYISHTNMPPKFRSALKPSTVSCCLWMKSELLNRTAEVLPSPILACPHLVCHQSLLLYTPSCPGTRSLNPMSLLRVCSGPCLFHLYVLAPFRTLLRCHLFCHILPECLLVRTYFLGSCAALHSPPWSCVTNLGYVFPHAHTSLAVTSRVQLQLLINTHIPSA